MASGENLMQQSLCISSTTLRYKGHGSHVNNALFTSGDQYLVSVGGALFITAAILTFDPNITLTMPEGADRSLFMWRHGDEV